MLFILSFVLMLFFSTFFFLPRIKCNKKTTSAKVTEVRKDKNMLELIVFNKGFYLLKVEEKSRVLPGDYIQFNPEEIAFKRKETQNGFCEKTYFNKKRVFRVFKTKSVKVTRKGFSHKRLNFLLRENAEARFSETSLKFIKSLVLGITKDFSYLEKNAFRENGISHLFAISGLHISLLALFFTKGLTYLKVKRPEIVVCMFLFFYLFVVGFMPSAVRASLMYFFLLFKKTKFKINSFEKLNICFLLMSLINPYFLYNTGFILSFLMSGTILFSVLYLKKKPKIIQPFFISVIGSFVSFPFIINLSNKINLLLPVLNLLYIPFVTFIILPLSFVSFIFSPVSFLLTFFGKVFLKLSLFTSVFSLSLRVKSISIYGAALYYFLLYLIFLKLKKVKKVFSLGFLIIFFSLVPVFRPVSSYSFLSLYNGEATIIFPKYALGAIVIDTGDGTGSVLTTELKKKGVWYIKALFITHGDYDHYGEIEKLKNEFFIKKIYVSKYDDKFYTRFQNVVKLNGDETFFIKNIHFKFLGPNVKKASTNQNSLVFIASENNEKILFTGDATKNEENQIDEKVTLLKVAHHGSNTSTSDLFLDKVKPKYAVIMSGRKWEHAFPSSEVFQRLKMRNVKIYDTKTHASIIFYNGIKYKRFKSINFG